MVIFIIIRTYGVNWDYYCNFFFFFFFFGRGLGIQFWYNNIMYKEKDEYTQVFSTRSLFRVATTAKRAETIKYTTRWQEE